MAGGMTNDTDPADNPGDDESVAVDPASTSDVPGGSAGDGGESDQAADRSSGANRYGRARAHVAAAQRRMDLAYQQLQDSRSRRGSIDVAFNVQEGDRSVGGSLLAGAIAFRMFLWLLPASLLVVAGLGFGSAESPTTPDALMRGIGVTSIAAHSVNQAAQDARAGRWLALILGSIFLYTTSVALVKALFVAHALVWHIPVPRIQHKPRAVGELLALILLVAAGTSLGAIVRERSPGFGLLAMIGVVVLYGVLWWLWSLRSPHAAAAAWELIPGAVAFGIGVEVLHLIVVYYLAARLTHASALYGSLGIAAAILFGLYLVGRLIIAAIVINVAVWERNHPEEAPMSGAPSASRGAPG
jgi:uncharacterized BrkB/YihY/UPF0761 family membrane protein